MKLDYILTPADFIAQATFELRFVRVPLAWLGSLVWGLLFAALLIVSGQALPWTLLVAVVAFICFLAVARLQHHLWLHRNFSTERLCGLAGEQHVEITEHSLRETALNRNVTWQWQNYSSLHRTPSHVFIKPTPINTVIIPNTAFASEIQREELIGLVQRCIASKKV